MKVRKEQGRSIDGPGKTRKCKEKVEAQKFCQNLHIALDLGRIPLNREHSWEDIFEIKQEQDNRSVC